METTSQNKTLGIFGEELACTFLHAQGYKVLLRNYECAPGEIDLIAKESGTLVFVEVKTRRSDAYGDPAEAVTHKKRWQIVKVAQFYLKRYGIHNVPCRFDVVSVLLPIGGEAQVQIAKDAFREGE